MYKKEILCDMLITVYVHIHAYILHFNRKKAYKDMHQNMKSDCP